MENSLLEVRLQLEVLASQLRTSIPTDEPFGVAQGNWTFPNLTRSELIERVQKIIRSIDDDDANDVKGDLSRVNDYRRRIQFLSGQVIPNIYGNAQVAIPAFLFTINGLENALKEVIPTDKEEEIRNRQKKLLAQIRNLELNLRAYQERSGKLSRLIEEIEKAHNTANQLPTDLETLTETRKLIASLFDEAQKETHEIQKSKDNFGLIEAEIAEYSRKAEKVLELCQKAYAASTSVGLAAAFSEQSDKLSRSVIWWSIGLVVALGIGFSWGIYQLNSLVQTLMQPSAKSEVIVLNALLSSLSLGAPIWFSWLASKQIGYRFRLSEDYAFKASVSRAYEGFRREASQHDKEMEARVLSSALSRFDEPPLRLVETAAHGSPWHELISSDAFKQALKSVPEFATRLREMVAKEIADRKSSSKK